MKIVSINNLDDLAPYRQHWDALADDCVFRSWTWLSTWWRHYGAGKRLFVLLVFADEQNGHCQTADQCGAVERPLPDPSKLLGILPCYVEHHFVRGQVLRLLGDGEVCSDHLDVLANSSDREPVAAELARYLCDHADQWDQTEFTAIGNQSVGLAHLSEELSSLGCHVSRSPNENCWSVALPEDWEEYLAMQSKSHRKQLRRLERRVLDSNQAKWNLVETPTELAVAWPILIDLHQRRRISLGEPGCFASERWAQFHGEVAPQLLDAGQLRLSWLEIAGQPIAAEYHFAGQNTTWAYQGGVDPDRIDEEPGRLSMICAIRHAIQEGHQVFDFLRGDEPYKAHWRAEPQSTFDIRIVPTRSAARWRWRACTYLHGAARVARQLTNMLG